MNETFLYGEEDGELWELEELEVPRVDLVRAPANRRRFALMKSQEREVHMEKNTQDFEEVVAQTQEANPAPEEPKENETATQDVQIQIEAQAGSLTDEDRKILRQVLELLQPLKEKLNPALLDTLAAAAGYPAKAPISPYPQPQYGYPQPMKSIEKALEQAGLPEQERERILKALKEAEEREREAIEKERKALFEQLESLRKANEALKAELDKQRMTLRHREFVEKAEKEYPNLPIEPEKLADVLIQLEDRLPEDARKEVLRLLKAHNDLIAKSAFLRELGTAAAEAEEDLSDPEAVLEERAKELAKERGIPLEVAKGEVLKEDRRLYQALRNRR